MLREPGASPKNSRRWSIRAWLGFDVVNGVVVAIQENAFAVRFLDQDLPIAVAAKMGEFRDEIAEGNLEEISDSLEVVIFHEHLAKPPQAVRVALILVKNRRRGRS